MTNGNVEQD